MLAASVSRNRRSPRKHHISSIEMAGNGLLPAINPSSSRAIFVGRPMWSSPSASRLRSCRAKSEEKSAYETWYVSSSSPRAASTSPSFPQRV